MFSSDTICYFNAGSSDTAELLGNYLSKILIKNGFSDIAPVLLCIGSDRVTGDSLGPMVGSALFMPSILRKPSMRSIYIFRIIR